MLAIAVAILIAGFFISFSIHRGFRRMSETLQEAEDALISVSTQLIADVATALTTIANSISEHIANGTAASVIQAQADKLKALDASVETAMAPPVVPPVVPVADPVTITTTTLPDGTVGSSYTASISSSGGTGPYTYVSSPPSDNGVTVNSDGSVSGPILTAADSTFSVTATDTLGATGSGTVTLHSA